MAQKPFDERRPSQSAGQGQVPFRSLFDIVDKLRCTKPPLLTLHFTIGRSPTDFSAECFKVSLALPPFFLLNRVAKLATRELVPQSLHRSQVCTRNVLYFSKIDKGTPFGFGSRKLNQGIACKLQQMKGMRCPSVVVLTKMWPA